MDYSEIKKIANQRKIRIKDLALAVGITENNFKVSFENGTLGFSKIPILCEALGITAAQFFDEEKIEASTVSISKIGNNNTIAGRVGSVVNGSESEVQFLRQQVLQLTEMNRELIKSLKK